MSAVVEPLLAVEGLVKHYPIRRGAFSRVVGAIRAVDGISFGVRAGETVALVGESGSGKTTAARVILRLVPPTSGSVRFEGRPIFDLSSREMRLLRRRMQIVFQDPYSSLNPRMTAGAAIAEPLEVHRVAGKREIRERVVTLLRRVGLAPEHADRYPHEFSGGQRQRIGIARALALDPRLIVCDEPVSALDVSVQAQILNLLVDLQQEMGLTYLFIAHDLSVVRHIAGRTLVMYLGKIVEEGETEALFQNPLHPYTKALLSAIPVPDPGASRHRTILSGDLPSPAAPPPGCPFHPRCPEAIAECRNDTPALREVLPGRRVACIRVEPLSSTTD